MRVPTARRRRWRRGHPRRRAGQRSARSNAHGRPTYISSQPTLRASPSRDARGSGSSNGGPRDVDPVADPHRGHALRAQQPAVPIDQHDVRTRARRIDRDGTHRPAHVEHEQRTCRVGTRRERPGVQERARQRIHVRRHDEPRVVRDRAHPRRARGPARPSAPRLPRWRARSPAARPGPRPGPPRATWPGPCAAPAVAAPQGRRDTRREQHPGG